MPKPQPALLPAPGPNSLFLALRIPDRAREATDALRAAASLPALAASVARLDARANLVSAVGFGPELWDAAVPAARPKGLRPFREIVRDSVELSEREKPADAHIARVVIEEDGEELEILRHSLPYGTTSEAGLRGTLA